MTSASRTCGVARFIAGCFFFAIVCVCAAAQQIPQAPGDYLGLTPYGSFDGGNIDSVNLTNGALFIRAPFLSYPQRGKDLKLDFDILYNGQGLRVWKKCNPTCSEGWGKDGQPLDPWWGYSHTGVVVADSNYADVEGTRVQIRTNPPQYKYYWHMTSGDLGTHPMGGSPGSYDSSDVTYDETGTFRTEDGTGWVMNMTSLGAGTLISPTGVRYTFPTSGNVMNREDANGNIITRSGVNYTDTMGRNILSPNMFSGTGNTDTSGCTGPLPIAYAVSWTPPGYNGGTLRYKFCIAQVAIYTPPVSGPATHPYSVTGYNLQSVLLPNGTSWIFEYNDPGDGSTYNSHLINYGSLTKITLPTGGTLSYTYATMYTASCDMGSRWVTSRAVDSNDGTGPHKTTYSWNETPVFYQLTSSVVTDPLGNDAVHNLSTFGINGNVCVLHEANTQYYQGGQGGGLLLKTVATTYGIASDTYPSHVPMNAVPTKIVTNWSTGQVKEQDMTYDAGFAVDNGYAVNAVYGEVVSESDYDYGQGAPGPLLRKTNTTYMALSGPNASSYLTNNLLSLPYTVQVLNGSGSQMAKTQFGYDESALGSSGVGSTEQHDTAPPAGTFRGNQTSISRWLNSGTLTCQNGHTAGTNSNVTSKLTFFDTGKLQASTDPCGNATTYAYSNTYWGAFPTTVTNALSQATVNTYDFNTGLLLSTQDPNLFITRYTYDSMWRLASVTHPDGGVDTITHQESSFPFSVSLATPINGSTSKTETNVFDGLGRVTQHQLSDALQGTIFTDTTYDALGRVSTVSNPHRTCGSDITSSCGTTSYGYDGLSRKTSVTYPDNSVLTTAYCGPSTLVTDPTTRWRRSRVDGLGRLVEVDEPNSITASVNVNGCPGTGEPIWVTSYTLDALGNLTNVVQNGSHQRSFTFDSLSRLLCSSNPETATAACPAFGATSFPTGTLTYVYNPDNIVLTKKDARNISTNYTLYDALHREKTRTYSNGDPTVNTAYDEPACLGLSTCQNIGHRTSMTDGPGSEAWSYHVDATNTDTTKRTVRVDQRTTNSITEITTYYLDLAGNINHITYPTHRVVNYTFDAADRPSTATDSSNGITYATGPQTSPGGTCTAGLTCYTPQGSVYAVSIGQTSSFTGLNITDSYNSRLQPNEFMASSTSGNAIDISYSFLDPLNSNRNAGHVFSITNNLDTTRSQTFSYDQVNRIITAQTTSTHAISPLHCWGEVYQYDGFPNGANGAWGNLTQIAATSNSNYTGCSQESGFTASVDGGNHISSFGYDASGNAITEGTVTYIWNAESQLKSAAGMNYLYDGDGRRVSKSNGKLYWYGDGSEILAETDVSGTTLNEYVFFGGKRIALLPAGSAAQYYVEDSLGTSRIGTTNTGVVCYDADFYPFGGERPYTDICTQNNYKFEGKERDTETGNDEFGARYYSNRFGRWLSADWSNVPVPVPYANLTNPQTLNLYAMVADDPESFADLDGHTSSGGSCGNGSTSCPDPPKLQPLNLCQNQPGCTQTTDPNGVTTVQTTHSETQGPVQNTDDSTTVTITTTTNTYTFNQAGNMTSGQQQTQVEQVTLGTFVAGWDTTTTTKSLSTRDAAQQFGTGNLESFQNSFLDTRGMWARYPREQAADIRAHPYKYGFHAIGIALPFTGLLPEAVDGLLMGADALYTAYELGKETH